MPLPIEDYAVIGDCHTAALVGRNGSIDWLCVPRFDSDACFAALLGGPEHGRWLLAPADEVRHVTRRYRDGTLILETDFECDDGAVRIIDFMPGDHGHRHLVRIVCGLRGSVRMQMELVLRLDYGSIVPWVRHAEGCVLATAGPDTLRLHSKVRTHGHDLRTVAAFTVTEGQRVPFVLDHRRTHEAAQTPIDAEAALNTCEEEWRGWSARSTYKGGWAAAVERSLITLKALTYLPTGGIVAAPTTSLPERVGGVRNWDYRYCWLRDATFTLNSLLLAGYTLEAAAWRQWLLAAVAGSPNDLRILYSVTGKRRMEELEIPWLPGYLGSAPVRIGNAASTQFQLDVYGEVMDTLHVARAAGLDSDPYVWRFQKALLRFLETVWQDPDDGIWEIRGERQLFTHSKVMAWVAFDRAVKSVESFGMDGPVEHWRHLRDTIHAQVCAQGYDAQRNTFVQYYGSTEVDASLLMIPLVGFLPPDDPRVRGTVEAIERDLLVDGLVRRYRTSTGTDGLPPGEGTFLPCAFWLADCLSLIGRRDDAIALFERLLALCNDVGLLSEEYDVKGGHMLGNFPQALTHMALINTARLLSLTPEAAASASSQGGRPFAAVETADDKAG
ncbi:MAG: glycoside hydrolase 15-related [Rhizobacter sp.]|nr:glycoside hydrolase 15-related [Rhizobacter sp.]